MVFIGKVIGMPLIEKPINPINRVLNFITENYPVNVYPKILEIAAGNGNLSLKLASLGYQVTAMEPKLDKTFSDNYRVLADFFSSDTDISDYDLGIAIHPCGIHEDIIQNFKVNDKALFLMPCYKITCESNEFNTYINNDEWLNYLETLNPKMKKLEFFDKSNNDLTARSFSNAFYTK